MQISRNFKNNVRICSLKKEKKEEEVIEEIPKSDKIPQSSLRGFPVDKSAGIRAAQTHVAVAFCAHCLQASGSKLYCVCEGEAASPVQRGADQSVSGSWVSLSNP